MNDGEGGDDCGDDKVLGGIMVKLNSGIMIYAAVVVI